MKIKTEREQKIVLITGASSGIGQATAVAFAKQGARVIFTYHANKTGALETGSLIRKEGMSSEAIEFDQTKAEECEKLFARIEKKYGRLDVLVNNAGGNVSGERYSSDILKKVFDLDCFGVIQCVRFALPLLERTEGAIVNITSAYGLEHCGSKEIPAYSAAKAAMNSFTRTLAKDIAPKVRINAVAPGYVETPIWGKLTEKQKTEYGKHQLIGRFIQPEEIARAIIFLAENEAVTGEVLVIDGGLSLKTV